MFSNTISNSVIVRFFSAKLHKMRELHRTMLLFIKSNNLSSMSKWWQKNWIITCIFFFHNDFECSKTSFIWTIMIKFFESITSCFQHWKNHAISTSSRNILIRLHMFAILSKWKTKFKRIESITFFLWKCQFSQNNLKFSEILFCATSINSTKFFIRIDDAILFLFYSFMISKFSSNKTRYRKSCKNFEIISISALIDHSISFFEKSFEWILKLKTFRNVLIFQILHFCEKNTVLNDESSNFVIFSFHFSNHEFESNDIFEFWHVMSRHVLLSSLHHFRYIEIFSLRISKFTFCSNSNSTFSSKTSNHSQISCLNCWIIILIKSFVDTKSTKKTRMSISILSKIFKNLFVIFDAFNNFNFFCMSKFVSMKIFVSRSKHVKITKFDRNFVSNFMIV